METKHPFNIKGEDVRNNRDPQQVGEDLLALREKHPDRSITELADGLFEGYQGLDDPAGDFDLNLDSLEFPRSNAGN